MVPKPPGGVIPPKGAPRLPPLPKLKIKRPNKVEPNPCIGVLSSVLGIQFQSVMGIIANENAIGCWASSGYTAQGCAQLEQSLRACMDARVCQAFRRHGVYMLMLGTETRKAEEELYQLPSLTNVSEYCRTEETRLSM